MRVDWHKFRGFQALRLDDDVENYVHGLAEQAAAVAGEGFEAFPTYDARNRARAAVVPVTMQAARKNARDNTLIRALGQIAR